MDFWETLGHKIVKNLLVKQLETKKFSHAYLFSGPKAVGKRSIALEFAKKVLGTKNLKVHPDFLEVKEAKEGGEILLEQILNFISRLAFKPFFAKKKIGIITNAQNLNRQSANALLKTLEEPSDSTIIILISDSKSLLPTIVSRCQILNFNSFSKREIKKIALEKNIDVDETRLILSGGSIQKLMELSSNNEVFLEEQNLVKKFEELKESKLAERILTIPRYAKLETSELEKIFFSWINWQKYKLLEKPEEYKSIGFLLTALEKLKTNQNKKLILQNLFINI